jgi:hypothetical protein
VKKDKETGKSKMTKGEHRRVTGEGSSFKGKQQHVSHWVEISREPLVIHIHILI